MSGQTRDVFCLMASSVSALTVLTSSLVPTFLLNCDSECCEAAFQSPSAGSERHPTRRSPVCTDLIKSACVGPPLRAATLAGLSDAGAGGEVAAAAGAASAAAATRLRSASAA